MKSRKRTMLRDDYRRAFCSPNRVPKPDKFREPSLPLNQIFLAAKNPNNPRFSLKDSINIRDFFDIFSVIGKCIFLLIKKCLFFFLARNLPERHFLKTSSYKKKSNILLISLKCE